MVEQIRLDGRVAIVTGAGRGLGRAYALALAGGGAAVVVNSIGRNADGRSEVADAVVAEIRAKGGRAVANYETVAYRAGGQAMVDQAMAEFGSVDIVVTNAGIQRNDLYENFDEQDMHEMLDVHLKGSFWVTQAAYRVMKERRYGRVVFTISASGYFGRPNSPAYCAAKNGIWGLMNSLAIEGASHNVLANAINPIALTRMTSAHFTEEMAERTPPEFVADLVVYLASEQCSITHQAFSAGVGRYTGVFVGRTTGWARDLNAPGGPEDIAQHLDEILDRTHFINVKDSGADLVDLMQNFPVRR